MLVTGGTGHLGSMFARTAIDRGHTIRIGSRRARPADAVEAFEWATIDLAAGAGLEGAVRDVDAVLHAASDIRNSVKADVEGTRLLAEAARAAGVGHFVYVSIVGVDRIPYPYYLRKLEAERALAETKVSHSILRAAQFHHFIDTLFQTAARFPLVMPVPAGMHVQTVATEEVCERLLRALDDGPNGLLEDYAGPEPMTIGDALSTWKEVRRVHKPTWWIPIPGRIGAAFRRGYNMAPRGERGSIRWREWLGRNR